MSLTRLSGRSLGTRLRNARRTGLALVLATTAASLGLGFATKLPCVIDRNAERHGLEQLCYTDISTLYDSRRLGATGLRRPLPAVEYPVGQALLMGIPARIVGSATGFFVLTAALLAAAALATTTLLHRLVGMRALYFSLAPTLVAYAFLNWDLLAVFLSTAALTAFLRRRDRASGILLGLGAAARIYPALFVVAFALGRLRERNRRAAIVLVAASALTWLALNLPFAILDPSRWSFVYTFSGLRPVHWATLWYLGCHDPTWRSPCAGTAVVNILALGSFVIGSIAVSAVALRRGIPMWTLCFPIVALLLLTNKVYSPQYSLWLIPWFALVLPRPRLFCAFVLTDLFAFAAEFLWIEGRVTPEGFPVAVLEVAVIARASVLVLCLIVYLRTSPLSFSVRVDSSGARRELLPPSTA